MNTRTLVTLHDDDKAWLDEQARLRARPMTQVVREAVAEYRVRAESRGGEPLADLLQDTSGLFARRGAAPEDGLAMQLRLRGEWAGPPDAGRRPPAPPSRRPRAPTGK